MICDNSQWCTFGRFHRHPKACNLHSPSVKKETSSSIVLHLSENKTTKKLFFHCHPERCATFLCLFSLFRSENNRQLTFFPPLKSIAWDNRQITRDSWITSIESMPLIRKTREIPSPSVANLFSLS